MTAVLEPVAPKPIAGFEAVEDRTLAAKRRLDSVSSDHDGSGRIEWTRPTPSAAFSRRDSLAPGFPHAANAVREFGYTPYIRPVGGRLAAYHDGALVLDVLARVNEPRLGTIARFRDIAIALSDGLRELGVDARVGGIPGEYCPGDWSVNSGGRRKIVGTGQRLVRDAVLVTAVIVVGDPEPLARVMTAGYGHLGLEFDPSTVGAVSDDVPGVTLDDVEEVLVGALSRTLTLDGPNLVGARRILAPWNPR